MEKLGHQDLLWAIESLGWKVTDPRMDGYNQFEHKKKLYEVLWKVSRELNKCSKFYGEEEWINEHKQDVFINKLEGKY